MSFKFAFIKFIVSLFLLLSTLNSFGGSRGGGGGMDSGGGTGSYGIVLSALWPQKRTSAVEAQD